MKTDKELLELAAKAAGYEPQHYSEENNSLSVVKGCTANCAFSPLTDDGDALRLAVNLEMDVTHYQNSVEVKAWIAGEYYDFISEEVSYCRISATRRAIVRAAAAIGEKL